MKYITIILCLLLTQSQMFGNKQASQVSQSGQTWQYIKNHATFSAQFGVNLVKAGETQTLALSGNLSNTYVANRNLNTYVAALFSLGFRFNPTRYIAINTALSYGYIANQKLSGDIWQHRSAQQNNLSYQFSLSSHLLMWENKLILRRCAIHPSLILGVGTSINHAVDYTETSKNPTTLPMTPPFANNSIAKFSYEIGAGLGYTKNQYRFIAEYRYVDADSGQLGLSASQNTLNHLSAGALHYNLITLGFVYHFKAKS